jgi:hypothetical protein
VNGGMMAETIPMQINFRQVPNEPDMFEFTISTPLLRSQFRIPRQIVNQLRVDLEKALINKEQ